MASVIIIKKENSLRPIDRISTFPNGLSRFIDVQRCLVTYNEQKSKYTLSAEFHPEVIPVCYLLVHTWRKEDFKVVGRKVIEAMQQMPKGATMVSSHVNAAQTASWCIWDTEHPEEVKAFLAKHVPEMQTTDIIPVVQFFPPGPESYKIMHMIASA